MDTNERLDAAVSRFAKTVAEGVATHTAQAVALETDRLDSAIAGIARALAAINERLDELEARNGSTVTFTAPGFANATSMRCMAWHTSFGQCDLMVGHVGPHRKADERW